MNDSINIKIGAEDAGFEATLKTVQNELKSLEGKVNSGDLTFKELKRTMKEIGQVQDLENRLKSMGGESSEASDKVGKLGSEIVETGNKSEKGGGLISESFAKIAGGVAVGELAVKAFSAVLDSAFSAARSVVEGFKAALDLGGTLSDLSAQTGESAGNLLLMQRAFDNTGLGAEKVGPVLAKLAASINNTDEESKKATLGFGRMGISLDELQGKSASEQLAIVSNGLQSIEDPGERAAAAVAVFGKSGAELLPLLSNFQGEMNEASATVGSLAEVMDRRAAVFDAISDRFKIIQEKVRDFAAGILDKALPAIDAITSALSRIDAAAVGQKLADAFLGGQKAMSGFQSAVDAISIGKADLAFKAFWESLKLQAMQTSDQIYKTLTAAFQTAGNYIGTIFSPSGALFQTLISGAEFVGNKMSAAIQRNLAKALEGNWLTESIALQLNKGANEANTAANKIEDSLKGAGGRIADQFGKAGEALPKSFEENYAKVPPLFDNLTEQQAKVAALEAEIAAAVAGSNAERGKGLVTIKDYETEIERLKSLGNEADKENIAHLESQLEKLKEKKAIKDQAAAAAAQEQAAAVQLIKLETQINAAKATGNEELQKSLEAQKKELENKAEIAKLTEEYQTKLGLNADEAARLAKNFVNAKSAAESIGNKDVVVTVTTKVNREKWDGLLASIAAGTADEKTIQVATQITGTNNLKDAYKVLQDMQTIDKNYQATFQAIGAQSIEEVQKNLAGIPTEAQAQLAMQITGEDNLKDAVANLDRFAGTKNAKLLLESQGFESMDAFQNQLNGIVGEKRTKLILESLGFKDAEAAKQALDAIVANDGKKASVTADANTTSAAEKIDNLTKGTRQVDVDANTALAKQTLEDFARNAVTLTLDASASIESIKEQFKSGIDIAINGSEGTTYLQTISGFVETIKDLVSKIEPKLPVSALA